MCRIRHQENPEYEIYPINETTLPNQENPEYEIYPINETTLPNHEKTRVFYAQKI